MGTLKRKSGETALGTPHHSRLSGGRDDVDELFSDEGIRRSLEIQVDHHIHGTDRPPRVVSPASVFTDFDISRLHGPPSSDHDSIYYSESEESEMESSKSVSPEKAPRPPPTPPPPENPEFFVDVKNLERQRLLFEFWRRALPMAVYKEAGVEAPEFAMMKPAELLRHDRDVDTYCGRQIYIDGLLDPLRNTLNVKEYERRNNFEMGTGKEIVANLRDELSKVLFQPLGYVVNLDKRERGV